MFDSQFMQQTLTPIIAVVGAVFGLIGTLLGVLNYRLSRNTHRVKLTVDGVEVRTVSNNNYGEEYETSENPHSILLTFKITNHSYFDVTLTDVGLRIQTSKYGKKHLVPLADNLHMRISARSSDKVIHRIWVQEEKQLDLAHDPGAHNIKLFLSQAKDVYAKTATGHLFVGAAASIRSAAEVVERVTSTAKGKT